MVKVAVIELPNPQRDEYLAAQPLCEHSVEVGKSIILTQISMYAVTLAGKYRATPKWKVITRIKLRWAVSALRALAEDMVGGEDDG